MSNYGTELTKKERKKLRRKEKRGKLLRPVLWSTVILLIGGTLFGVSRLASSPPSDAASKSEAQVLFESVSSLDWVKGNLESEVILVEYSDFQCPACATYHTLIEKLMLEYGDQVRFVYRHFPLSQHNQARLAAYAAEAAGKQGKFWQMHRKLFERQSTWADQSDAEDKFINYARELQLDVDRFKADFYAREIKEKVAKDLRSGFDSGVNATPTFFLNGEKLSNLYGDDDLKEKISHALSGT